jgi:hypothetical protein
LAAALAATAVVAEVLPMRTRFGTPWAVIHHLPGAGAMRAIDRVGMVAGLAVVLALSAAVAEVWAQPALRHREVRRGLAALVIALVVVEQINTTRTSTVNRPAQKAFLAAVSPAPSGCGSFYVIDSTNPALPFFESQLDAMLASQKLGLPTVNGYTAYNPIGWNLADIGAPDYPESVRQWASKHRLPPTVCQLDLATMRWRGA